MIHVIASLETVEGRRDGLVQEFKNLVPTVLAEVGCLEYGPTIDVPTGMTGDGRANVVTVVEKWESLDALKDHLAAPHMVAFRETVKEIVLDISLQVLKPA